MGLLNNMLHYETEAKKQGFRFILGTDEAGRGPLAGPVVASAVCLKTSDFSCQINDSKKLTPRARHRAFLEIFEKAYVGIGCVSEIGVDQVNILNASFLAMERAVEQLIQQIELEQQGAVQSAQVKILVDGNLFRTRLPFAYQTIIEGDAKSLSIAAASIIAKTYRDRVMGLYDRLWPQYGFKSHKGYPTASHKQALLKFGPSMIHRKSFAGVL